MKDLNQKINLHGKFWLDVFMFYGKEQDPRRIQMLARVTCELTSVQTLRECFMAYIKNPINKFPPSPAELLQYQGDGLDSYSKGVEIANVIEAKISSCGWTNPDRAREEIGQLGWEVVNKMGGWTHVCKSYTPGSSAKAQIRELAIALCTKSTIGILDKKPTLPCPKSEDDIGPKRLDDYLNNYLED